MLVKSSSGINIGNGKNCTENRKPTITSFSSSSSSTYINKCVTKTNTVLIKPSNVEKDDIKCQEQQLNDFIQPANSFLINSLSSFQSEGLATNFKFELIPETINHFKQYQTNIQRRPHLQWTKRHGSSSSSKNQNTNGNSSIIFLRSSIDLNTTTMSNNLINENTHIPDISITEMTNKDFDDQYQQSSNNQNDFDQTLKTTSMTIVTNDNNEKAFVNQASQSALTDTKIKKTIRSANYHTKIKSATKRPKQPSATQIIQQQPILSSTSPNRTLSQNDINTTTVQKLTSSTTTTAKVDDNNAGKTLITVDITKARSNLEVVRFCIRELGWKECFTNTNVDSDIYWHSSSFHEGNINFAFSSGRVNKFPGMNDLLRKVHLTRLLNNMRLLFPNDFDFYPKTWFLPEQTQQFKDDVRYIHQQDKKHNRSLTTFIVKPSDGSQGEGIYLLRDPAHCIVTNRQHVVQEYIDRPLLINGLKFDLRIYVVILNLYPLEIFLYDEGLVRFATVGYKAPSTENLHQTYMHLTNYSLNKHSNNYKHTTNNQQTDGSKRKLSTVWIQLIEIFGDEKIERTKILITEMINKTILAILPELRVEYEFELPLGKKQNISCFQIVGFDIILTDHLKPILLEVNANPSLRIDFDKENGAGKLIYQSSPIDEEIKKPLVLETLKLALPKKKLSTFVRHVQSQVHDELMAQRVEKVAQRRVEERNEKIKSARKTRFDVKSNPFFSRPSDSITKEFIRLHQEQQEQNQQQKVLITSPTHTIDLIQSNNITTNTQLLPNNDGKSTSPKIIKRTKKLVDSTDDDESGTPETRQIETNQNIRNNLYQTSSTIIKRSNLKSASNRSIITTDTILVGSIQKLKMIFPLNYKTKYRHLFLLDKIAYIYIQLVIMLGHKTMTSGQFRNFANICGIINETITAPTIDILYYQIQRKWQQFVLRTSSTGLPFPAFIEVFFLLSQRKFPNTQSLLDSVSQLVNVCVRNLNTCLQTPSSPLIQQSNQYLLQRASRINSSINQSSMNNRSTIIALRSTTTTGTNRTINVSSSAPISKVQQIIPSATAITKIHNDDKPKHSAKSVFPLFF
ncbi:unnamed protein product [Rotaria sordida]|uniref:Uncharacterized protein n=1 Tax=Rotaria sordida TaxID=392033 RepID=A0A814TAB5_9BILA|nr:unnamed protein product [Rotaria sordida]